MAKKYITRVQKHYYIRKKFKTPNCIDYAEENEKWAPKLLCS